MGAVPSTPRRRMDAAEFLIGAFVGRESYPLSSDFWQKLLELPLTLQWPRSKVEQACEAFVQNNYHTRHLVKLLVHLISCLQESASAAGGSSPAHLKAVNAAYIATIFLKYSIENAKSSNFDELYLSFDGVEGSEKGYAEEGSIANFFVRGVLNYIGTSDLSPQTYLLHHELLSLSLVLLSTQLRSGPTPGFNDVHPFIDAAMLQDTALVGCIVKRLLLNYISQPRVPFSSTSQSYFYNEVQSGVLQRVGSAAASFVLLPYYTFNYLISSGGAESRSPLADKSLLVLLILIHYRKCIPVEESTEKKSEDEIDLNSHQKQELYSLNPYKLALENARDVEFDRMDVEGNAQSGPLLRLSFASLFDTVSACLADESSVLLLYSFVHGNPGFLEYVLVRTDLDTLLIPILEMLYNASRRTPNQIYMLLIILLILSQDLSFNATIHKLILTNVPWYQERLLHHVSLGSLMIVILIRTVNYNLSKLRDMYLHTNCLAILANMAPHVYKLNAYASQRLVSLFDMLSRKYNKLAELKNFKDLKSNGSFEGDNLAANISTELHIYTDFLRIVLEIINSILTYALPRNPEVVYALMHRQEVFQPFKDHPRFNELLENIYTVLDFFNSRLDANRMDGEWSVEKVLQAIIINCRYWRVEGLKTFTQLRFTYEQESHPEEFFIPYVWQLALSERGFTFNPAVITLFPTDVLTEIFVIVVCNFMIFKYRVTKQEIHGKDGTVSKADESA